MSKQNTEMMGHSTNRYTNPIMHWYKQRFNHVVRKRFEQGFEYKSGKKQLDWLKSLKTDSNARARLRAHSFNRYFIEGRSL